MRCQFYSNSQIFYIENMLLNRYNANSPRVARFNLGIKLNGLSEVL